MLHAVLATTTQNIKNIVEPPITVKTIDCVYQRGCRKEAEQPTVC